MTAAVGWRPGLKARLSDAPTALELMGLTEPEPQEGLASLRQKRDPRFDPKTTL